LFKPQAAMRIRWDNHGETPLSPEFPASENPPDGAIIYYSLQSAAKSDITLDFLDARGNRVRHYSSKSSAPTGMVGNAPDYWFAPPAVLNTKPGLHRFVWDLRAEDPQTLNFSYYGGKLDYIEYTLMDHAIPGQTPRQQPPGALLPPGSYEAVLTVDGKQFRQKLQVVLDPRVHATPDDLIAQWSLARLISTGLGLSYNAYGEYESLRAAIKDRQAKLKEQPEAKDLLEALGKLQTAAAAIGEGKSDAPGIGPLNRDSSRYLVMVESADMRPPVSAQTAALEACKKLQVNLEAWSKLNSGDLAAVNKQLEASHLAALPVASGKTSPLVCVP
jgi:hypothetical protein